MAIDSAAKRKSISGIPGITAPGVTPDATPDQTWRQAAGWSYNGILAGLPVDPEGTGGNMEVGSSAPLSVNSGFVIGGL